VFNGNVTAMTTAFARLGGDPALDFVNTVTWDRAGFLRERLASYDDLLAWTREARLLPAADLARLARAAARSPGGAAMALARAHATRDDLHQLFVHLARRTVPPPALIASVERRIAHALSRLRVEVGRGRARLVWPSSTDLGAPVWPIVKAAVDLVGRREAPALGLCANPDCGWLFLDQSRRGNRRWCSMAECGSRAKARRHYRRKKQGARALIYEA